MPITNKDIQLIVPLVNDIKNRAVTIKNFMPDDEESNKKLHHLAALMIHCSLFLFDITGEISDELKEQVLDFTKTCGCNIKLFEEK